MKPLISVLVDTYNHERYIEQALASVLEQGLSASELQIVVVDDGSTDKTPEIIEKFVPRVKYVRKKNGGQASAFNAAFPELQGQIVALLDGDDWFAKGKLNAVIQALERDPEVGAAGHGYYEVNEKMQEVRVCVPAEEKFLHLGTPDSAREAVDGWRFVLMGALTVRKEILARVMPIPEVLRFCGDAPVAMSAMAAGVRVLPLPLFYYRRHGGNLYAIDPKDEKKIRRRNQMDERLFELLDPMLLSLGVSRRAVDAMLFPRWTETSRLNLRAFGGKRRDALRIEMRHFRSTYNKRSIAYRAYKCVATALGCFAIILLSPNRFYRLRDWYTKRDLGGFREWLYKQS